MAAPSVRFFRSRSVLSEHSKRLRSYWSQVKRPLLGKIEGYTNLEWKIDRVNIHIRPSNHGGILGWMKPFEPHEITVYLEKDNRVDISTITHELVHSNIWSNYASDNRWRELGLFEDIFADELLTEVIGQKVCIIMKVGGRRQIDYSWAIRYGFITTFLRVGEIIGLKLPKNVEQKWSVDRRRQSYGLKSFRVESKERLIRWSKGYFKKVKRGETNAMDARRRIVESLPSLSDYLDKEVFFRNA